MPTNKSANKANNISRKKDEKNIDKSIGNADLISSTELSKKGANKSVENDLELLEKELWEVSPKTTGLRSILEQVSSMLDCEVPRYQTVSTRMKEENWKKLTKIELKKRAAKSDETTTENQQFFSSKIELKKEIKTVGCEDSHSSEKKAEKKAERAAKKPMNLDVIELPPSIEILVFALNKFIAQK
jgi:hypothetical protein